MGVMYICEECGIAFYEDEALELKEHMGNGYYETYTACPNCKSSAITDAERCKECGGVFRKDELHEGVCRDCVSDMLNDDEYVVDYITERGFDDFWEMINNSYSKYAIVKALYKEFMGDAEDFCEEDIDDFVAFCLHPNKRFA